MHDLPGIIFSIFLGASILVGVLAIGARIAFKPILESWLRLRQTAASEDAKLLQDRRINLLEAELQSVQQAVEKLIEDDDFQRQLEASQRLRGTAHEMESATNSAVRRLSASE